MSEHVAPAAYLETADQNHIPILVSCSIGRAASNHIVLQSEKVSRHHASIQLQQDAQYWLMDLGTSRPNLLLLFSSGPATGPFRCWECPCFAACSVRWRQMRKRIRP